MAGALDGVRIVDLTTVILGPWATQMLGDMGADVIKVETHVGDTTRHTGDRRNPEMAAFFMATNRNKRSVVLDLRQEEGREALFKLVGTADVFVHNMRPSIATKLGLDDEKFLKAYPKLVYVKTYGFRGDGPMANKPAYDDVIQAASGVTDLNTVISEGGEPRYVPTIMADKTSSFHVVSAVLAALYHREKSGEGQVIEVPMFEALVDYLMVEHMNGAAFDPPIADMGYARLLNKMRKPYKTQDGYLCVLPYTDQNWQDMFKIAGREDLMEDPRFVDLATRTRHSGEIYGILEDLVATRSTAELEKTLNAAAIPVQKVNTKEDLLSDEQLAATGFWQFADHPTEGRIRLTDPPVRFSKSPSSIRLLQPRLGEQSAEVLGEAGFSEEEIAGMFAAGVSKDGR
ncbi:CoA transferase [uncultured Shimia sp.]|uniref:CaiB/BaiF CoA transferase family protein n=1 Tax=uncultured Shimia sp. TaxID=573152 RepID=UPI0025DDA0BB|nr:CoA transferase [uncultured Shimia sp.]